MLKVTFDTTEKPNSPAVQLALRTGWHVAYVTVSVREAAGTDFEVELKSLNQVVESGVWGESKWGLALWSGSDEGVRLEEILKIIADGSFPPDRSNLSEGQKHQLRDAMILSAHAREHRDVFVTADQKAFVKGGKKEKLESLVVTRILSSSQFVQEFSQIS